ncbi:glycoside hydrolase family 108 protein [Microvirga pudoricolor]|uniref:glycoside hydrolase family 108 protein n=1 Tax=Microvirga pudoricolor TaxID=2778729 RepID=UPI00194DCDDD|nr:glycoside hydrolase family 108 protein [Microvirga pudoricolor]MBM6592365.1 glycoside hydrolase family 108 protein [Microvirga pudoricolor]
MTARSFEPALRAVLDLEGGFVRHPGDPGGATNRGITQRTLARARGRPVTVDEVRALTAPEAGAIYRRLYWDAVRADGLPAGIDLALFDFAVHSGPARSVRALQRLLGVRPDGRVGRETLLAAAAADPEEVIRGLTRKRLGFLQRLGPWRLFGRGWKRRVLAVERAALALVPQALKEIPMPDTKSILASRTVWSNLLGLLAVLAGVLGFDASGVDSGAVADAIVQIVAAGSFIASTLFRILATQQIRN